MTDLGVIDCQEESSRAVPGLIREAIAKGRPEPLSLVQLTMIFGDREQAKAIDHAAIVRERDQLLDLKIKTIIREEDQPVPEEQDLYAIDYLAEFDIFIGKKNLPPHDKEFVLGKGRAALQTALEQETPDAP